MDSHLLRLLKKYNLKLVFLPVEEDGFIVHTEHGEPDHIVIRNTLPESQIESVVLHEIGHARFDCEIQGDYTTDDKSHSQSENGANGYMIEQKVKSYIDLNNDALYTNYINLANAIGTKDYQKVKKELQKHIDEEHGNE